MRESLTGIARGLGPGAKLPTVSELCSSLRVSTATLNQILKELESQHVIERYHGRGIYVSESIGQIIIGVVFGENLFDEHHSPFWRLLVHEAGRQSASHGFCSRIYMDSSPSGMGFHAREQLKEDLLAGKLHGLLLLTPLHGEALHECLGKSGVPMVTFGGTHGASVDLDNDASLMQGAAMLAGFGCRNVVFIGQESSKAAALEAELSHRGLDSRVADWSYEKLVESGFSGTREECVFRKAMMLLSEKSDKPLPDGVLGLDDTMTRGLINAMNLSGMWPSENMEIVTSSNKGSPVLYPYAEFLTRIEFDPEECIDISLKMLKSLVDGGLKPATPVLAQPKVHEKQRCALGEMLAN